MASDSEIGSRFGLQIVEPPRSGCEQQRAPYKKKYDSSREHFGRSRVLNSWTRLRAANEVFSEAFVAVWQDAPRFERRERVA
jgi:hypothetical protein